MKKKFKIFIVLIILFSAFLTRFYNFNQPAEVVFDEVHFGKFVRSYFTHENYFDIHPPLAKLLIAGWAKFRNAQISQQDFSKIGQDYNPDDLYKLRFLPALFSVLFILLIYLFTLRLTGFKTAAFVSGLMVLFDNAIIVQSRIALLDIFLLFFGFLALYLFLIQEDKSFDKLRTRKWLFIILSGLSLGASYSVKWTGLSMIFMIGLLALYQLFKNKPFDKLRVKNWREFAIKLITVYLVSFILYVVIFSIHFALLTKPGPGDAFLSPGFREKPFVQKFYELNEKMFKYNKSIATQHPYQSKWSQWPFNKKPVFYWQETPIDPEHKQEIWLKGNTAVWYLGTASIIIGVLMILIKLIFRRPKDFSLFIPLFLIAGWLANFLPFVLITRPLFLYSYFLALIFSIILFAYLFAYLLEKLTISKSKKRVIVSLFAIIIIVFFLFFANLTYGI
ncbi:phospholipid carrier-dependent glycosyltransferase [Patescibacteria group bacterium]|nr:phospholipid carrier-dependent glycosyltransferase [Patescibacteria group bacterium]